MQVVEQSVVAKSGLLALSEDVIVVSENYVAVIDGATAKSTDLFGGRTPGQVIAVSIGEFLNAEKRLLFGAQLIQEISDHVKRSVLHTYRVEGPSTRVPAAAAAIFTSTKNVITAIGDVHYMVNGKPTDTDKPKIDSFLSEARALYTRMLQFEGIPESTLSAEDPGRKAILPFLEKQYLLRNNTVFGEWSYGAIDGLSFDARFVQIEFVRVGDEVVFCSDGYPSVLPTLNQSEEALQHSLKIDPLRVGAEAGTKGMRYGDASFDDRAYIRFLVDC